MYLKRDGISINYANGGLSWTTPQLNSAVMALQLLDNGNLVLLDKFNISLWQSFDHPTDTILLGQSLYKGKMLASSVSVSNLTTGDYRFSVTSDDAVLQWGSQEYWKLSTDPRAAKHRSGEVSYLQMNQSGIYLFNGNGAIVIWGVGLSMSNFQIVMAKLDYKGRFNVISFSDSENPKLEFIAPVDDCHLPIPCGRLGLCRLNPSGCSCPPGFHVLNTLDSACLPSNSSDSLPSTCNSNASFKYLELGGGFRYFAHNFVRPTTSGADFFTCQDLCTRNCSCLGFIYMNSSDFCYLLKDPLGSFFATADSNYKHSLGYIKMVSPTPNADDISHNSKIDFPMFILILIPCIGVFLSIILLVKCVLCRKGLRTSKPSMIKLGSRNPSFSEVFDAFPIPGLPARYTYEELEEATDCFRTPFGSGAYGTVFKGTLPDKTPVAVKKINSVDVQGKGREFCTEISVVGKTRHVNLVRLMGFCAQGPHRLLVLEYMNRGSLDRALFGTTQPVLEWPERLNIALGAARGLAYLHGGCENKIIHLDVKPENILLDDQTQVKISDFGLSKLMNPEQSSIFTIMRGTRGYLAPEWLMNTTVNDKIDVYSYGMVLLEIVSGRRNCSPHWQGEHTGNGSRDERLSSTESRSFYYPLFALEMHQQGRYLDLVDPRLHSQVTSEEVERVVRIALCCLHLQPMLRPSMANVVSMLEGRMDLCMPRVESLKFLLYGRWMKESEMVDGHGDGASLRQLAAF